MDRTTAWPTVLPASIVSVEIGKSDPWKILGREWMNGFRGRASVACLAAALLSAAFFTLATFPLRAAEDRPISVDLNKLEPQGKACRAYLVIDNLSDAAYQALRLDTYLFRTDGVIDRRLLIDLAPMQATKRSVKPFDLDGIACEAIGSFLVNGVTDCRDASGPVTDCLTRLRFTSRASATLSK